MPPQAPPYLRPCSVPKMSTDHGQQYDSFDANVYLRDFYGAGKIELYASVPFYVELFSRFSDSSIEMLDFGGGPTIIPLIIAARKVSRYIHADYAKNNRTAVERWWKNYPDSFDWRENVRYILKLEGNNGTDEEVTEREDRMRKVLGEVVHCDILVDQVVPPSLAGPFDVVTCLSCLDCVCTSVDSLHKAIGRLSSLVRSGGYLIVQCSVVRADHKLSEEEQQRKNEAVGEVVHTEAGYVPEAKYIGGFQYKGFFYESMSKYVKLMESCGFTVVKQFDYICNDPSTKYTDSIGIVVGKKM